MSAGAANDFWIETGGTSSVRRYQIDFREDLADFFEEKTDGESFINILFDGDEYPGQKLLKKQEDHHFTPQWRLYLPRGFQEYDDNFYPNQVVKFEKTSRGGQRWYEMEIADVDGSSHDDWREMADQQGTRDSTDAVIPDESREFGYY